MSKRKTYRKYATTTMAAAVAATAMVPAVAGAEESSFSDVSPEANGDHYANIIAMADAGIIQGKGDGTFAPFEDVARVQVAKMLQRALNLEVPANSEEVLEAYTDVSNEAQEDQDAIAAVTAAGVFFGDSGNFNAWTSINREQMASVIVRAYDLNEMEADEVAINLDNVDVSHKANVQILANLGLTTQLNEYRPAEFTNREQFATFLNRTIEKVAEAPEVEPEEPEEPEVPEVPDVEAAIESVSAINATTLLVMLDNGTAQEVVLENGQELELNEKTEVSFAIDGVYYTADVTWMKQSAEAQDEIEEARDAFLEAKNNYDEATENLLNAELALVEANKYGTDQEKIDAEFAAAQAYLALYKAEIEAHIASLKLEDAINDTQYALEYEAALSAVEKAERSNKQVDLNAARQLVNGLDNSYPRNDLGERLDYVESVIDATEAVADLEDFVAEDGFSLSQARNGYDVALDWVNDLEDGDVKTALLDRLAQVKETMDDAATAYLEGQATEQVEYAEAQLEADDIPAAQIDHDSALIMVEALEDGDVKTALLDRLEAVQEGIDAANQAWFKSESERLIQQGEDSLATSNYSLAKQSYDAAVELVEKLDDGDVKTDLEAELTTLGAALDKYLADTQAAAAVNDLMSAFNASDSVDPDFIDKVEAARTAYDALNDEAKEFVTEADVTKLEDAEGKVADYVAAQPVQDMIDALPTLANVTLGDKAEVEAARTAFQALSPEQQALITDGQNLIDLEAKLVELQENVDAQLALDALDLEVLNAEEDNPAIALDPDFDWTSNDTNYVSINTTETEASITRNATNTRLVLLEARIVTSDGTEMYRTWNVEIRSALANNEVTVTPL